MNYPQGRRTSLGPLNHTHGHAARWTLTGARRRCAAGTAAVPVETRGANNSRALTNGVGAYRYTALSD